MPLEDPTGGGFPAGEAVRIIQELQSLKVAVVAGAAAVTNITVAGAKPTDTILSVLRFDVAADTGSSATGNKVQAVTDLTSEASFPTAGHLQFASTDTTGDTLAVLYYSKPS